ncbi:ABC transporter permease subunit [Metabacillus sp. GX 13764]|uniref:ABC transporter permease subunit n=1 Tax=Metabacillus kandeliae TaxID=2900151 RepID=UPI001E3C9EDE|nr:ABC transporter permease subunit [Metabacillus kandeliae]MCD7035917.1 ABC transporter permease subunit [Metabacillus kandeliae]
MLKLLKSAAFLFLQCFMALLLFILIGALPSFFGNLTFHFSVYLEEVWHLSQRIYTLEGLSIEGYPLLPILFDRYLYSMSLFGLGLLAAFVLSAAVSYLCLLFFRKRISAWIRFLEMLEAIPDLLFIVGLQMLVIYVYKATGVKLAQVVTVGSGHRTYLLPVLSLALPAAFFITKILLFSIREELDKNYVLLARASGFSFSYILNVHVLRNIWSSLVSSSKTIYWAMMSSLMAVEYLFSTNGLLSFMLKNQSTGDVFVISCVFLFVPFIVVYRLLNWHGKEEAL